MKKFISIFALLLLLGSTTMVVAEEALSGSTTEWLEDLDETTSTSGDGC